MGRPPPEGARVAYALAQFIFIVRDPIDTHCRAGEVLQISVPAVENIKQIAGNVRHPMNTTHVHKRLMNEFLGEPGVRELLDVYQSFGYTPSP
jgi:hypothetical protein